MSLLDIVIALPLVAFLIAILLPKQNENLVRVFALGASLITFLLSLGLIGPYWFANPTGYAFETNQPWIATPPIAYHVALDGLSLWLVLLTTLLTPICVLISWKSVNKRSKEFFAFLLLLEFGLVGVFCAVDLFLFFVFWEVSLVPMYFLVGIWGHDRRIYAAVKFFLYTMAGSMLMLTAIIYLNNRPKTFDYATILAGLQKVSIQLSYAEQLPLFLAFFIAFAIKVPLFPLHTWLPDAHVEAPTAGSVMLASVMLKMGTYGLLRFCLPLFPNAARMRRLDRDFGDHRHHLRRPRRDGATEYEEAGVLFVGESLGFRRARPVHIHAKRFRWRGLPDAESRRLHRRFVHPGGLSLRTAAFARDRGLRRRGDARAQPYQDFHDYDAGQHRLCRCSTISWVNSWSCRAPRLPTSPGLYTPRSA